MQPTDYLVHFSNILLLVAYSVRDMLWLRWFAVAAALTNIPYFLVQDYVLWPPVLWASVFTAINLYQIARIYKERRPVVLAPEQQTLYDLAFPLATAARLPVARAVGEWCDAKAGERLLTTGDPAARICIAISGDVEVYKARRTSAGSRRDISSAPASC